jgi:hypothetical protein
MGENYLMDAAQRLRPSSARPHDADAHARQADAELRTTQALEDLDPDTWTVISDLEWPGGRYGHVDHVVIGPSGVYVVDTTTWNGDISVYGDRLRYEGVIQDSVVTALTEAAAAVAVFIPGVPQLLVRPVLCADGAEGLDTHVDGVLVCSTDTLASMLEARVHSMSTHQLSVATRQLREHLHDRSLVKAAAKAGHQKAKRREFVPMRGVPVIRIAIVTWFASVLVLAPHTFTDAFTTIQDKVERHIDEQIEKQRQLQQD